MGKEVVFSFRFRILPFLNGVGFWGLFLAITFSIPFGLSQSFCGREISTRDGLPSNMVYGCFQEKSGAMWFCTELGLSRYDGSHFRNYAKNQGLADSDVFKIFQDSRGRIWLLLSNGEINMIEKGKVFNRSNHPLLNQLVCTSYFNGVAEDPAGNLWFSSLANGIFKLSPQQKLTWLRPLSDIPASLLEPGLLVGADHQIRIGANTGVINLSRNPAQLEVPAPVQKGQMDYFTQTKSGTLVLAHDKSIWFCRPGQTQFTPISHDRLRYLRGVNEIREDPDGDVWIATLDGLFQIENGDFENGKIHKWLENQSISSTFFDRQGNFWILTLDNGILLVHDPKVKRLGLAEGLPDYPICRLTHYQNRIWVGNNRGQIGFIDQHKFHTLNTWLEGVPQFGRGAVREFRRDPVDHSLWVLTENALFRIHNEAITGIMGGGFKSFAFDSSQNLVIGTTEKAFLLPVADVKKRMAENLRHIRETRHSPSQRGNPTAYFFPRLSSILPVCRVNAIETDPGGTVWFATSKGLFSYEKGRSFHHKEKNPTLGRHFHHLVALKENEVLAGSNGLGLVFYNGIEYAQIHSGEEEIRSVYFKSLKKLSDDSVLAATPVGLILFSRQRKEPGFRHQLFGRDQGLDPEDMYDVQVFGKSMVTASKLGLTLYPGFPVGRRSNSEKPRLHKLSYGSIACQDFSSGLSLAPNPEGFIRLELENVDFQQAGHVLYRYRLNKNQVWTETRQVAFSIPLSEPGHYELEVQYRSGSMGTWKTILPPIPISLVLPIYQKPWFWVLGMGIVALGILWKLNNAGRLAPIGVFSRPNTPAGTSPAPWIRYYLPVFQNGLDTMADFLAQDDSEAGLLYLSRLRFMGKYISARINADSVWLLKDEFRLTHLFFEAEQTASTQMPEIPILSELEPDCKEIPFPPFLLALLVFAGTRFRLDQNQQKITVTAVRIGEILQLTVELDREEEEMSWPPELLSTYQLLTREIRQLTEEYKTRCGVKLEVFYPHIKENRLTSSRFQVWIPVK